MNIFMFYMFGIFIEAIVMWQYSTGLFTPRHPFLRRMTTLMLVYLVLLLTAPLDVKWLNAILYFMANFIFLSTQYNVSLLTATLHSVAIEAIMGMCEMITYSIMECFTPHFFANPEAFYNMLIFAITSKMLFFCLVNVITHIFKRKSSETEGYDISSLLLTIVPITSVIIMLIFVSIGDSFTLSKRIGQLITSGSILLLITNILVFGIQQYSQKKQADFTAMQLRLQKEASYVKYYELLCNQNSSQRILIHDIKNHLNSILLLANNHDYNAITNYIQNLSVSPALSKSVCMCDNELLNLLLCHYSEICKEKHISFHADIKKDINIFIADNDITSLFGNLLDNAVDAALDSQNPYIDLSISNPKPTNLIMINVINSCTFAPIASHDGSFATTKADHTQHGTGLKSICNIIKKYNGNINMYYDNDTKTFHTIITIKEH